VSTLEDFYTLSNIAIVSNLGILVLPYVFIKLIRQTTGDIRKNAIAFVTGIAIFMLSALVVNASLLSAVNEATGMSWDVIVYLIQAICKIIGMVMFSYSTTKMTF
jgi:hypothetical protein